MCGIAGVLGLRGETIVREMLTALEHRGPDAQGIEVSGLATIGHRRLSVIDTSAAANQPFTDNSGRYCLTYNGEVYNYLELRRELEAGGAVFRTRSDTEVVLQAFITWGEACLDRFNGMFAFAVWDNVGRRLFLARDRLGEKPLFYAMPGHRQFVFASEPQVLEAHPEIARTLSLEGLSQYLQYSYTTGEHTLWRGIQRFPPAHYAWVEADNPAVNPVCYWDLARVFREKRDYPPADYAETLNSLIDDSVNLRIRADVPFGAFLSGGIDSSAIVASMSRQIGCDATRAFSIGFASHSFDELEFAQAAASHLDIALGTRQYAPGLEILAGAMDIAAREPLADSSILPMQLLARMTRESVTVALSGDGADEIFLGYPTHQADRLHHFTSRWLAGSQPILRRLAGWLPTSFSKVSFDYRVKQWISGLALEPNRAHAHWRQIFAASDLAELLNPALRDDLPAEAGFAGFQHHFDAVAGCHYLDRMSYVDIKTWLADDILTKVDRATMASSLESRAPFLDHRLVEFAARLPVNEKLKGMRGKHVLKQSQRHRLPASILERGKRGFNAPVSEWFNGPLATLVDDRLASARLRELFCAGKVEQLLAEHRTHSADHGLKLFALVLLSTWLDNPPFRLPAPAQTP